MMLFAQALACFTTIFYKIILNKIKKGFALCTGGDDNDDDDIESNMLYGKLWIFHSFTLVLLGAFYFAWLDFSMAHARLRTHVDFIDTFPFIISQ